MVKRANLLIEIGCEELPPAELRKLSTHFANNFADALRAAEVLDDGNGDSNSDTHFTAFATPRRLAVLVRNVAAKSPARTVESRGPSVAAAFDQHSKPTKAALGFAKSNGVTVAKLSRLKTDKGEWLAHTKKIAGKTIAAITTDALAQTIRALPVAKRMRWGAGDAEFVRPVHWLLALHGDKVVNTSAFGLKATRATRGHRFHANHDINIPNADNYAALLKTKGTVIADFDARRTMIKNQLAKLAEQHTGANVIADDALLDMVTGMVEYPRAVMGAFDKRFLKLPDEVLIACMRTHQKYFHLTDTRGKLLPAFITVANIRKAGTRVQRGNERVLRARLADAEFFYNNDLKTPLADRVNDLKKVLFHKKLGTLYDKTKRVQKLAGYIAEKLNADKELAMRAARLCKTDLVTDMVGEFPELQGIIGCDYAKQTGESKAVADAIAEHYLPRYAGDRLPKTAVAQSVAIADRLDSLVGLFAADEKPSGDRDPFALRRAALGVSRILIENKLDLGIHDLLEFTDKGYATETPEMTIGEIFYFLQERLRSYYQSQGYGTAEFNAVMESRANSPLDFDRRLRALRKFVTKHPAAAKSLAAANKRIFGIVRKVKSNDVPTFPNDSLLEHPVEIALAQKLDVVDSAAREHFNNNRYDEGLTVLSTLKQPVDDFFDGVMVMVDDPAIRNNRLALLNNIRDLFRKVADISLMSTDK